MKTLICLLLAAPLTLLAWPAEDETAVREALQHYVDGWYRGDAARMEIALHPELIKRKPVPISRDGKTRLEDLDQLAMIAATREGIGQRTPVHQRLKQLNILDIRQNSAVAMLETGEFFDYVHLVRNGGRWQIVNVLWEPISQ